MKTMEILNHMQWTFQAISYNLIFL